MATVGEVVEDALIMGGICDQNEAAADHTVESARGLDAFKNLLWALPGMAIGANELTPVLITAAYTAGEDEVISYTGVSTAAITLPTTVEDVDTGDDRAPRNGARVQIAGGDQYLYLTTRGDWVNLSSITTGTSFPLGDDLLEGFTAMLAVRLAGLFNVANTPNAIVMDMAQTGRRDIRHRFRRVQRVSVETALLNMSSQSHNRARA